MIERLKAALLAAGIGLASASAADSIPVVERTEIFSRPLRELTSRIYGNPAMMPERHPVSLGMAEGVFMRHHGSRMATEFDPSEGESKGMFRARAYIHAGSSTVWGEARYENGFQRDVTFCESSDYAMVYPYVQATQSGGNLNLERYAFSGGWAGRTGKKWTLGASLAYEAGLYFRKIDPRPRNVTGNLRLTAGVSFRVSPNRLLGAFLKMKRYTQSSSITFVSEMGSEPVYHLTGLGNHYARFDGLGSKMNYTAYVWTGGVQTAPRSRGLYASATLEGTSLRCLISDLNKLPMARVSQTTISASAGWLSPGHFLSWGVAIEWDYSRRNGFESIFGDAASSVFPCIGELKMYADDRRQAGLTGVLEIHSPAAGRISLSPRLGWSRRREIYRSPRSLLRVSRWEAGAALRCSRRSGKRILLSAEVAADLLISCSSGLHLPSVNKEIDIALQEQTKIYYDASSRRATQLSASGRFLWSISKVYAVALAGGYSHLDSRVASWNAVTASLQFYF